MPFYNYKCSCGNEFEELRRMSEHEIAPCTACGGVAEQTVSGARIATHGFKYGWFEHLTSEPVYAKSKKHLKELCNRYEAYAPGVLD